MDKIHKEPVFVEMENVEVARCLNSIKQILTIHKLVNTRAGDKATELLKQYFYSELGKEEPNICAMIGLQPGNNRLFVNSKDENKLFPRLRVEFENKTREIFSNDENKINRVLRWLNLFMEEWEAGAYGQPKQQDIELTEETKQAFAKAIEQGWITEEENGCYLWKESKARLAYFIGCLHNHQGANWKLYERVFNQKSLQQSYYQVGDGKQKWKVTIDIFFREFRE